MCYNAPNNVSREREGGREREREGGREREREKERETEAFSPSPIHTVGAINTLGLEK